MQVRLDRNAIKQYNIAVKLSLGLLLLSFGIVFAEDSSNEYYNEYYMERYPNDGMKQLPKKNPSTRVGDNLFQRVLPQRLETYPGETNTNSIPSGTNATRAARYTAPRISSKEFAPSRQPPPKTKIVVVFEHKDKFPPSPAVTDKAGAIQPGSGQTPFFSSTNQAPNRVPCVSGRQGYIYRCKKNAFGY